jgi:cytochrome P450
MGSCAGTPGPGGPTGRPGPGEWTLGREADIRAALADARFTVLPPGPGGPPGTVAWLRASVSRFAGGAQHRARRALIERELRQLEPAALGRAARQLAVSQLAAAGRPGDRADVMSVVARPVPAAALAAALGLAGPLTVAAAVNAVAAAYFPGADARREQQADPAVAWLVAALTGAGPAAAAGTGPLAGRPAAGLDLAVARIAIMVQACEATAGLIGTALHVLQDAPAAGPAWPTSALLAHALRYRPPAGKIRRVAAGPAQLGGRRIRPGDQLTCDIESAGRDPQAGQGTGAGLAFGSGIRPCPGPAHALALAAGVVDAVRERCVLQPGAPVAYEASATRIPRRLDVLLR